MRAVLIVPTGIGCPIGGHAGDANPVAKLIAAACDELIVHPNVVNASDINEMPENCLYVDGYALDSFLEGLVALRRVRSGANKVLVVANRPVSTHVRNAVGAARATLGIEAEVLALDEPLRMHAKMDSTTGGAGGHHSGVEALIAQVSDSGVEFDALAMSSEIEVDKDVALHYMREGGVNPWGWIEAHVSRRVAEALGVPVAHAPLEGVIQDFDEVVDDRRAAECVSVAYLHCVLKGLHRSPALIPHNVARPTDLHAEDVDVLISPANCWGRPHDACMAPGIEVVWVRENWPAVKPSAAPRERTLVANYLEAAGLISARRAGVSTSSVGTP